MPTQQVMPERDVNNSLPKEEKLEEGIKSMQISSQKITKGATDLPKPQYQFNEHHRTLQQQQRYRTSTNPDGQHSMSSLHSASRACYSGPVEPAFTSLNPAYAFGAASLAYPTQHHMYQTPAHSCHNYPASMTSTQFDRIAVGVNHGYSSCLPAYEPAYSHHSLLAGPPSLQHQHHLSHPTTTTDVSDSLMRRDNEIERLRMRIVLLEQQSDSSASNLINGNSSSSISSFNGTSGNSSEMQKLNKLEYEAQLLRSEMGSNMSRDEMIVRLEQSLNQKEYEIQENQKAYNQELDLLNKDLLKVKEELFDKDQESQKEKAKNLTLQRDLDKLQGKLDERDAYIGQLPTIDEVAANKQQFQEQSAEIDALKAKIKELEIKVVRAKEFIREKNREVKQGQERCETVQMEKERVEKEFELYKEATQNVGELMSRCEENASIRAEFELAKKMILKCEEKNKSQQAKYEERLEELNEAQRMEQDVSEGLRKELEQKEKTLRKLSDSVKEISKENQSLLSTNLALQEQCRSFELMLSADTTKLLHLLFIELSACTSDLDSLVNNVIDIYSGKEIDMNSLLGCGSSQYTANADLASTITQAAGLINNEFISTRTNDIKGLRERITKVRTMVSNEYADRLGGNMSCATQ